jgi:hypothetical protein
MLNTFELIKYIFLLAAGVLQIWLMIIVYKKSPTTSNFWFMMTNNFIALCWFNVVFSEGIIAGFITNRQPIMFLRGNP